MSDELKKKIVDTLQPLAERAFCPTGEGGGIDNSCSSERRSSAQAQLDQMQRLSQRGVPKENGDWVTNFLTRTPDGFESMMETALIAEAKATDMPIKDYLATFGTEEIVAIDLLSSGQSILNVGSIQHFLNNAKQDKLPIVIQYGEHTIIRDGNHRIAAAKLKGEEKIKVNLVYVSERT